MTSNIELQPGDRDQAPPATPPMFFDVTVEIPKGPVSYTHLDVYKRQPRRRAAAAASCATRAESACSP